MTAKFTSDTEVKEVIKDPAFRGFGRLLFPLDSYCFTGKTLSDLRFIYCTHMDSSKTVEILNDLKERSEHGEKVFYNIYSEEEMKENPELRETGLFFFKGKKMRKFAVCNAGGAFAYVGAMHDSFPHALELSRRGYNAFALIYRPDAMKACEDLARAIQFIFEYSEEVEVDTECYSLWGGSAGARMAAWIGMYGPDAFGASGLPRPGSVIMQYTGLGEYTSDTPPTYACVGDRDGIANWRVMEARLEAMKNIGIDTEFHVYPGLSHGFGLGTGTCAQGWIIDAVAFWEKQMK